MTKKLLVGIMVTLSLLFTSCYPELSVQQYDELKEDLKELDVKRAELEGQVEQLEAQIVTIQQENAEKNAEVRKYVRDNIVFLEKMISTQSSARILTGEFDVESLVASKDTLMELSKDLKGSNISYYLEMLDSDNETKTVAAYYKIVEYCFKEIKDTLK